MGKKGGFLRYADGVDKLLLVVGTLGCLGDGLQTPITMLVLGSLINDYAAHTSASHNAAFNHTVDKYALRLLYIAIGVGLSAFIEGVCWTRTSERQTSRMRIAYLKSMLRQEVGFFDNQSDSSSTFQVISTISSDAQTVQDTLSEKIPLCLVHLTAFFSGFIVALILSWRLAVSAFPFSIMMIMPAIIFGKKMKEQAQKMKMAYGVAGSIAEQAISSVRTVYSYVGEKQTLERFGIALEQSMKLGIKMGLTKGLMIGSFGLIYATWAFQTWVGSVLVTHTGENGGNVFCAAICIIWGGLSLMSALPNVAFIAESTAAATRIYEMIDRVPAMNSGNEMGKMLMNVRGEITFKDVIFSYPSRPNAPILKGLNLKLRAGRTIGLVGGSGSGKSTIISLVERFYDPSSGEILLDGHDIKRLQPKWLRSQMGLVNQEPILFATSIKENILLGKEAASMEEVESAAKAANAHDFILKLDNAYDTQVGQLGTQLSGGQKQRIAIARALIRNPKILLLDEATSALDSQSEKVVQEALDLASRGRTTIIVAHRLSTIRNADSIVVLQSGRVVESGSHDDLIRLNNGRGGTYSKMLQLQQSAIQNEQESTYYANHASPRIAEASRITYSNFQSSPIHPFSPIYSISIADSLLDDDDYYGKKNPKNSDYSSFSQWRLMRMNAPEWKHALLGCFGAIGSGICQPIYSYCLGIVASVYFINDKSRVNSEIRLYSSIFCIIAIVNIISGMLQHYNFTIMGERLLRRVRENLLAKVLTFEVGWFDKEENTSAAICSRLANEANLVRSLVAERMSLLIQVLFMASLAFSLGLVVSWRVAIVMIAMQPLIIACFYSRIVLLKSMSAKSQKAQREGSQLAMEATINHRTITAFSSEKRIVNLFRIAMKGPHKESIRQSWISGSIMSISQFLTTASITLTFWYGGRLLNQGLVESKNLLQVFLILMGTGRQIAETGSMTSDIAKSGRAIGSVFAILDRESEIEPEDDSSTHGKSKKTVKGHIKLKNVFFCYPARPDQMILNGLTLEIEAGKTMALVGQSGSGKSTIIGLIERFYDPMKGSISIDDYGIKEFNLRKLRSSIALVSQEPTLFAGTIRDNIVYGKQDASEDEIRRAARRANAHEFISSMKDGYDTNCGERGVQLSGGQKQRIAIARAILKDPSILLLDEATSALDSVSENLVQEALEKMMIGRTCVVIAHRLSTIQSVDSIAVIKNGKVVEQGSHSELLAIGKKGAYYSMIRLQHGHTT